MLRSRRRSHDVRRTRTVAWAMAVLGAIALFSLGCEDSVPCLAPGQNCSENYKQSTYGTVDIFCCQGSCQAAAPAPAAPICQ